MPIFQRCICTVDYIVLNMNVFKSNNQMSYTPLFMSSANALMDLVSDKSSLFATMFWFPESSINSFLASSAFSRSRQAMMTRAPEDNTERS